MDPKNTPVETLRDGRLKATIWENQSDNGPYHSINLAKVYEDKNGNLQESSTFSPGELLRIAELARESHGIIRQINREVALERHSQNTQERPERAKGREAPPRRFQNRSGPSMER